MARRALYLQELELEAGYHKEQGINSDGAIIDFAKEGIKAGYLMNASGIGLLAIAPAKLALLPTDLIDFSKPFFVGLVAAVSCNVLAYFAQSNWSGYHYGEYYEQRLALHERYFPGTVKRSKPEQEQASQRRLRRSGMLLRYASILTGLLSFAAFAYGGYSILDFWNLSAYP
jgi:hypothetical protein